MTNVVHGSPLLHLLVSGVATVLPWSAKRFVYRILLGHDVHEGARVGFSLVVVGHLELGDGAQIGHLNLIRNCDEVRLGDHATIGNLNWINAVPSGATDLFESAPNRRTVLDLGPHSAITFGHFVDCSDVVELAEFATIGGYRSQIMSHSVDLEQGIQTTAPVRFGAYSFLGTGAVVLQGADLCHHAVVGAGSMLRDIETKPYSLYSGVPATYVKELPEDWGYFTRTVGYID